PTNAKARGISPIPAPGLGNKCRRLPMTLTPLSTAAMRAMKMSRHQPARRPSAPKKMLRAVKFFAGASGAWFGGSGCGFSGSLVEGLAGSRIGSFVGSHRACPRFEETIYANRGRRVEIGGTESLLQGLQPAARRIA